MKENPKGANLTLLIRELTHELNNLFHLMLMSVQVGLIKIEKCPCDAKIIRLMENIQKAIEDGQEILLRFRSLITSSQSDTTYDVGAVKPTSVDINSLIKETIEMALPQDVGAGFKPALVEVITNLKDLPATACDPSELREVLINLIKNARDAMPEGGWLIFNTWAKEDEIFITVFDLGKGIPGELHQKVFEPHFTTKGAMGDGLGLAISNRIISQYRGDLQVLSAENVGTTFVIRIPVKVEKG